MIQQLIIIIALSSGVDPNLLLAICYQESRFKQVIVHDSGSLSYGPCQVKTIAMKQVKLNIDLTKPENSVRVSALYLKYNLERCKSITSAIAAYNTGKCLKVVSKTGYTSKVLGYYEQFQIENNPENFVRQIATISE